MIEPPHLTATAFSLRICANDANDPSISHILGKATSRLNHSERCDGTFDTLRRNHHHNRNHNRPLEFPETMAFPDFQEPGPAPGIAKCRRIRYYGGRPTSSKQEKNSMDKTKMCNANGHVRSGKPIRGAMAMNRGTGKGTAGQPVLLKAVFNLAPNCSDEEMFAEVVNYGGKNACGSRCDCCNQVRIAALFSSRAKALEARETLEANRDAEVEILTLEKALSDRASQDDLIIRRCVQNR